MALARDGIDHRILAPDAVSNFIIEKQVKKFNRRFIHPHAPHTVASVDTLLARADSLDAKWLREIDLAQTDEGHHCLADNKWGRALNMFPNAQQLAWTGTPMRPDRRSLRRGFDTEGKPLGGVYDVLVTGPSTGDLLGQRFLTPYRIFGPPPSIDMTGASVGASGDWSREEVRKRAHKSRVVGDLVDHYLKLAPGRIGIAFLVDVDQAKETAERFRAAGVRATWMSSRETDDRTRVRNLEALEAGELQIICNVDLLGEGVDVPRVEVILDGRPTASLVRYLQAFGRLLRLFEGKEYGIYIDAVGNVIRHGLPDAPRDWSLDVPERRARQENDEEALKMCVKCFEPMKRFMPKCPHCGHRPAPMPGGARRPEEVDGDLTEYSPALLAQLMEEAARVRGAAPRGGVLSYVERNWNERAVAHSGLDAAMAAWSGVQREWHGRDLSESYRLFWHRFGIDVATAGTLSKPQAIILSEKIWEDINKGKHPFGKAG